MEAECGNMTEWVKLSYERFSHTAVKLLALLYLTLNSLISRIISILGPVGAILDFAGIAGSQQVPLETLGVNALLFFHKYPSNACLQVFLAQASVLARAVGVRAVDWRRC